MVTLWAENVICPSTKYRSSHSLSSCHGFRNIYVVASPALSLKFITYEMIIGGLLLIIIVWPMAQASYWLALPYKLTHF